MCLFRKKYGKEIIGAENGKKENRSATGEQFTFEEFLNVCCKTTLIKGVWLIMLKMKMLHYL